MSKAGCSIHPESSEQRRATPYGLCSRDAYSCSPENVGHRQQKYPGTDGKHGTRPIVTMLLGGSNFTISRRVSNGKDVNRFLVAVADCIFVKWIFRMYDSVCLRRRVHIVSHNIYLFIRDSCVMYHNSALTCPADRTCLHESVLFWHVGGTLCQQP